MSSIEIYLQSKIIAKVDAKKANNEQIQWVLKILKLADNLKTLNKLCEKTKKLKFKLILILLKAQ